MLLEEYGFDPAMLPEGISGTPARVTAVLKDRYELVCEHGQIYGRLKTSVYFRKGVEFFPITGDFVLIKYNTTGDSLIIKTLERRTYISRGNPSPGRGEQSIAANFDYVFIMQSTNHDFDLRRMERYIALARQSGADPVVLLTKADMTDEYADYIRAAESVAAGARVYAISAKTGFGLNQLRDYLKPRKTIVLLGSSGVGKSSFVNALAGEEIMPVNEIGESDSKGRHTTTRRQLIMLKSGVMVIDTPGMREDANLKESGNRVDFRHNACNDSFICKVCGAHVVPGGAGTQHRNHCPNCLSSVHVDNEPGDRASLCKGIMDPIGVWVRKNGEWAIIHRCRSCGELSSNRIAADDNPVLLMSIAVKPLAAPPFPLGTLDQRFGGNE